ncbi:MAG: beta-lactamase family protein [Bacteroidetes bacterium]|nr:beta-lactamase family protein [Bacteroidota bacterium]
MINLNSTNSRISFLRRIVKSLKIVHRSAIIFKYPFLLSLLLISSQLHQAFEKSDECHIYDLRRYLFVEEKDKFPQEYVDYISENVDVILARFGFNGAVLIAQEGQILFEKYNGLADLRDTSSYVNSNTLFQLASVGKQFTAIATVMLKERGYFEYDDFVADYIDSFPYPNITIRHLLNHTSGLQNYMYLLDHYWKQDSFPKNSDLVSLFAEHNLPLNFSPGRRFAYSNTGYAFLALLIEEVSAMPFADFMKQELFIPLGMNNTFVYSPENNNIENRSFGFSRRNHRSIVSDDIHDGIVGDKGFFSTSRDLFRWDMALTHFSPISKEGMQEAVSKAVLNNGREVNYGFGWRLKKVNNYDFVYHHGWWHGFRTVYKRIPEKNIVIIILNNTNSNIGVITRNINKLLLLDFDNSNEHIADNQEF